MLALLLLAGIVSTSIAVLLVGYRKNMHLWLGGYLRGYSSRRRDAADRPIHIMFCFVDHYEPKWRNPNDLELERARVDRWLRDYPRMANRYRDADGKPPQHTFFYPAEEYRFEHLDKLARLCRDRYGEIEVHLHHDNDTSENLWRTLSDFTDTLHREHGALSVAPATGEPVYAFIHGNWCLDNSRPDGRWCGVNDEITVLKHTGCYADFTFPAAPDPSQPPIVNAIYRVNDDPHRPCSHFTGEPVLAGKPRDSDLLVITGPLMLNWTDRKYGIIPKIENSDIRHANPPTPTRVDLWIRAGISVAGRADWRFVKIHTHGAQDTDMDTLLGEDVASMHEYLGSRYNDGQNYVLHYVTAREMYNIVRAAEDGKTGNPALYRDYELPRPTFLAGRADPAPTPL